VDHARPGAGEAQPAELREQLIEALLVVAHLLHVHLRLRRRIGAEPLEHPAAEAELELPPALAVGGNELPHVPQGLDIDLVIGAGTAITGTEIEAAVELRPE